jgi:hypothetical protein
MKEWRTSAPWRKLADIIRSHEIEYRDPPNVGCCHVGASMTSVPRRVVEYWRRDSSDWQRDRSLEIGIADLQRPAEAALNSDGPPADHNQRGLFYEQKSDDAAELHRGDEMVSQGCR